MRIAEVHMKQTQEDEATVRVHPFPTLIAQCVQLTTLAHDASPDAVQVLANSALVFAAMSLECAATSCLEFTKIPKAPHGAIDRTLSVIDKFDLLHWLAVRAPLDRGQLAVQKIDDLVKARNRLVHARMKRLPFGAIRKFAVGEGVEVESDKALWSAIRIPKDERNWDCEHAKHAITAAVEFLNYFFFEACKIDEKKVAQMLCTSSGDVIFRTPWESQILSSAAHRFGLKLRFLWL
jgi:hypothetical protein